MLSYPTSYVRQAIQFIVPMVAYRSTVQSGGWVMEHKRSIPGKHIVQCLVLDTVDAQNILREHQDNIGMFNSNSTVVL